MNRKLTGLAILSGFLGCALAVGQKSPPEDRQKRRLVDPIEGQALYQDYCATCHGETGKGDGPVAKALRTAPPDLTHIWMRNGGKFPMERVRKIISGETELTAHGTREMPLWGPIFAQATWDEDLGRIRIRNLAEYLQKIQSN